MESTKHEIISNTLKAGSTRVETDQNLFPTPAAACFGEAKACGPLPRAHPSTLLGFRAAFDPRGGVELPGVRSARARAANSGGTGGAVRRFRARIDRNPERAGGPGIPRAQGCSLHADPGKRHLFCLYPARLPRRLLHAHDAAFDS